MKYGVNKCMFVGNVGREPEMKYTANGTAICKFSLACNEKRKTGDYTEWVNVVSFGKLAEIIGEYVKKGDPLYVEGKQSTSSWEKDGQKHYRTECVAMEMRMLGGGKTSQAKKQGEPQNDTPDDGIPF